MPELACSPGTSNCNINAKLEGYNRFTLSDTSTSISVLRIFYLSIRIQLVSDGKCRCIFLSMNSSLVQAHRREALPKDMPGNLEYTHGTASILPAMYFHTVLFLDISGLLKSISSEKMAESHCPTLRETRVFFKMKVSLLRSEHWADVPSSKVGRLESL